MDKSEMIEAILGRLGKVEGRVKEHTEATVIDFCPKCKHETLQKYEFENPPEESTEGYWGSSYAYPRQKTKRVCLTCGAELVNVKAETKWVEKAKAKG